VPANTPDPHPIRLTGLEELIMTGLAGGKPPAQICRELAIGRTLYQTYLRAIRRRLGARTTVQAVFLWARDNPDPGRLPDF